MTTAMSAILVAGLLLTGSALIMLLLDQSEGSMREFAVLGLFCAAITLLSYYVELNTPGVAAKVDAVKFGYIGKVFVNPMLLMLAVRYYSIRIKRGLLALMYVIPVLTLYLVFTCERQDLYYREITLQPSGLLQITPGPAYFAYIAYNTLLAMVYLSFCLYQRAKLRRHDRKNNTILLAASLVPFGTLMVYLSGWTHGYDISTVGVMIGAMLVTVSIFRFGLLNKEEMLQNMSTGLIFLEGDNRLFYANRAAEHILPALKASQVRSGEADLAQLCEPGFASVQVGTASYQRKITEWSNGDGQHGKLITFDDITEIRARLKRDEMTGLLNHATFYPMLDDAMAESNQKHLSLSVSIADIDSFKKYNDTYGHANGDIILIALADVLQEICGTPGDVFRYGGEEFAIIFHCDQKLAEETMQKALDRFSSQKFPFMPDTVTFSYGSAEFNKLETSVALFDRADHIMYERKKAFHERERLAAEQADSAQSANEHADAETQTQ